MNIVDPSPPREPIAPEEEIARGDVALPAALDTPAITGAPIGSAVAAVAANPALFPALHKLISDPAVRARGEALRRARDSDADEVLSGAHGHVVAGED